MDYPIEVVTLSRDPLCEMKMLTVATRVLFGFLAVSWFCTVNAQSLGDARPVVGLRENLPDTVLLKNARVVLSPDRVLPSGSIAVRGKSIVAVGKDIDAPAGAKVIDCSGQTIYAGLIDAYSEVDVPDPPKDTATHWNGNVMPRRKTSAAIASVSDIAAIRSQGVAARLVAPQGGIVKGISAAVLLDRESGVTLIDDDVAQHLQLTVPRDRRRNSYPNSPMGAIALLRQTLYDAEWYGRAMQAYQAKPTITRPQRNEDLQRLGTDRRQGRFIVDAPNERMFARAEQIAREFSLQITLRGSGREYRDLQAVADAGRVVLVPVDFPKAPHVVSEAAADEVTHRELLHWHFAPENPARLAKAGVVFCLTSDGLDDPKSFLKNIRTAVSRGLSAEEALAATTTVPAALLGCPGVTGRIEPGTLANLVITRGDLFDDDTEVLETWVAGERFQHSDSTQADGDRLIGDWQTRFQGAGQKTRFHLSLNQDKKKWTGKLSVPGEKQTDDSEDKSATAKLEKLVRASDRLTAWVDLSKADAELPAGPSRLTLITVAQGDSIDVFSTLKLPAGDVVELAWQPHEVDDSEEPETKQEETEDNQSGSDPLGEIVVNFPLGAFGVVEPVAAPAAVLFRGGTVWTCDDQGVMEKADVLVVDGKISQVGSSIEPPDGCQVIDVRGKHISPGLIDCHSHMATDGGVNESGQAVTAEVRIGDFIDNSDINIYRQLAGGLTTSNILHGSANPIGGQNQVIKLRWGDSMDAMKLAGAPGGIKFALGENVKRSNRDGRPTRYPSSRMGVEQIMRDRLLAARDYVRRHQDDQAGTLNGLPPRRDLELDALAEILSGDRWIHCHSYRQDEIVTLLDLLDRFDVTIGSLQHILEGYKVADRMRRHGATASAFSDWWAYKFEVYDAIADNGAIMHDQGIVVSFNSDSAELARHLNTEAAKAVKYGGVSPEEALKFVTLNPAKQLRIDDRVGSITPGKDADLVVWSDAPLSTLSRCEQTWVDGRPMFSLQRDRELRQRDARWRAMLIGRILDKDFPADSSHSDEVDEEDRWLRYDEFCGHDHHDGHDHTHEHQGETR